VAWALTCSGSAAAVLRHCSLRVTGHDPVPALAPCQCQCQCQSQLFPAPAVGGARSLRPPPLALAPGGPPPDRPGVPVTPSPPTHTHESNGLSVAPGYGTDDGPALAVRPGIQFFHSFRICHSRRKIVIFGPFNDVIRHSMKFKNLRHSHSVIHERRKMGRNSIHSSPFHSFSRPGQPNPLQQRRTSHRRFSHALIGLYMQLRQVPYASNECFQRSTFPTD